MAEGARSQPIAIVGMAGRVPSAPDVERIWQLVREGREALRDLSEDELRSAGVPPSAFGDPRYVRKASVLEGADEFDRNFFGIAPREAQILDPQQRVFLECAWEALEHAGAAGNAAGQAVGVYAGAGLNAYLLTRILANPELMASVGGYQLMLGSDKDFLATRVSYKLDLHGPSLSVQTACSTSLVAVVLACQALERHDCDLALAGGVSILCPQTGGYLFEEGMIFSPDGHCRPFDAAARGTRGSSGAGVVVLKRLKDALRDRDTIHSVILGAAINNDGANKAGYTAPSVEGQVEVIAAAQALAGVDPRSIDYVEAHGTGTALGDPIEVAALTQVFRAATDAVGFCRLGSLKANIGHLDAAAGVASLIKATLALEHRELPPLVNFESPNPALSLETSPFVASATAAPWPAPEGARRRAGVSSLGIGGTNAHVVLEEAPPITVEGESRSRELLVLSAKTEAALERASQNLRGHLLAHPEISLGDVAYTLAVGRREFPERRALVARDAAEAAALLATPERAPVTTGSHPGGEARVAFLFSGQGSQHVGMAHELYREEPVFRDALDACAVLLEPELGLDLRRVLFDGEHGAELDETRLAQPALFTIEYALAKWWMSLGVEPSVMLGHSIGEFVAAHLAGVMTLSDALRIVAGRARLMQAQAPGSMAAVPLAPAELERWLRDGVELGAINAPGLCAVSGPRESIARLVEELSRAGVEARLLHTSHAFHSQMMEPALAPFRELVESVKLMPPGIPYVSNVTGTLITDEQATSPAYYAEHLRRAVQFEAGVTALAADPSLLLLEVGPSNVLCSLARMSVGKHAARRVIASLPHPRESRSALEAALDAAGRLWLAGAKLDFERLHEGRPSRRVPLPTYPFERERYWVDPAPRAESEKAPRASGETLYYAPTWIRDDSRAVSAKLSGAWLILGAPGALSDAVRREVEKAGGVAFSGGADAGALIAQARKNATGISGAIYLWSAETGRGKVALRTHQYDGLVALAAALEPETHSRKLRIVVATLRAESVLDEKVRDVGAALATGPVLVLPTEVPDLELRSVDFAALGDSVQIEAAARALVEEAAVADYELSTARRAGRRWLRRLEPIRLPEPQAAELPLKTRGVYLVTGGLGGLGLALSRFLAERFSARLLLTARSAPGPEALAAIQELERLGSEVLVIPAAAEDADAMRAALDAASARFGAVDGVIHAAGVPGTGTIALRKQADEVAAVLAPKLDGLAVLVKLLGSVPLDFVALFSSINSVLGSPGTADYASANAVLDAFVDSEARPLAWRRVVAFDWGPWREVGMAAKLAASGSHREHRALLLERALSSSAGIDAFARVLASGRGRVVVSSFELARAPVPEAATRQNGAAAATVAAEPRPRVSTEYQAPQSPTQQKLAEIWRELLGVERVGGHDDFFELGGHSLLATRVLSRVDQSFGARLSLRDVFDAPTLERFSERIDAAIVRSAAPSGGDEADREEVEF